MTINVNENFNFDLDIPIETEDDCIITSICFKDKEESDFLIYLLLKDIHLNTEIKKRDDVLKRIYALFPLSLLVKEYKLYKDCSLYHLDSVRFAQKIGDYFARFHQENDRKIIGTYYSLIVNSLFSFEEDFEEHKNNANKIAKEISKLYVEIWEN